MSKVCIAWNRGIPRREETKQKIRETLVGRPQPWNAHPRSDETKQKISLSCKGRISWNKGKHHSEKSKQKLSDANKGQVPWNKGKTGVYSVETLQNMSDVHKDVPNPALSEKRLLMFRCGMLSVSDETRKKLSDTWQRQGHPRGMLGKHHSNETKRQYAIVRRCELNPAWQGGVSFEPYGIEFDNSLREQIRKRDDYLCQICGCRQNGELLSIHHIDYDKQNNYPDNLVSLCRGCHSKTNFNRTVWQASLTKVT